MEVTLDTFYLLNGLLYIWLSFFTERATGNLCLATELQQPVPLPNVWNPEYTVWDMGTDCVNQNTWE